MKSKILMLVTLLTLLAATIFVGCSKDDNPASSSSSLVGTYTINSEVCSNGDQGTTGSLTFNTGGSVSATINGTPQTGTYSTSGSALTISIGGSPITAQFAVSGTSLIITWSDGCVMTCTKSS